VKLGVFAGWPRLRLTGVGEFEEVLPKLDRAD